MGGRRLRPKPPLPGARAPCHSRRPLKRSLSARVRSCLVRHWPLLALATLGVLLHGRELLGERPYGRDVHQVYVPVKSFLAAHLARGELPQWWPFDGTGAPLLAQPYLSIFHPTTLLYALFPFWTAFVGQTLAGTVAGLVGAGMLARETRLSAPATLVAGALYGLCGYVACLHEHTFMHLATATLPWYVWALLRAQRVGGRTTLLPSAFAGLLLLAGDPQTTLLACATGLVLMLARAPASERRRALWLAVLSPVAGGLLAAVQLLPSLLFVPESERAGAIANLDRWHLEAHHLAGMLLPLRHGIDDWVRSTFVGWAGIALAAASLARLGRDRRGRTVGALWALVIVSTWLALGDAWLLNPLARATVPLWSLFRYPMKSIVVAYLALALLAGHGFDALARRSTQRRGLWLGVGGLAVTLALSTWVAGPSAVQALPAATLASLAVALVAALATPRPRALRVCGALVISCQLLASAWPAIPTIDPSFYAEPPLATALRQAGVGLYGPAFERPFHGDVPADRWAQATRAGAGGLGTTFNALFGLPSISPALPGSSGRVLELFARHREVMDGRLLGVFGVGFVVLREPLDPRLVSQVIAREPEFGFAVVALRKSLPRAYLVRRARAAGDREAAIAAVTEPSFKPGREVVLEGVVADPQWASREETPAVPVEIASRTNRSVTLRAQAPWDGWVVLNEAASAGWRATVDAEPSPVLVANGLVRAVAVPAGAHEIVLRYTTPGLATGAAVSLAALALLLTAALLGFRRPRSVTPVA